MGARDLRAFCRPPMGVPVAFAGVSTYPDDGTLVCGNYDRPRTAGLADRGIGGLVSGKPTIMLPCNAFDPMPASGGTITVWPDGEFQPSIDYLVEEPTAQSDGGMLLYELKAVYGEENQ